MNENTSNVNPSQHPFFPSETDISGTREKKLAWGPHDFKKTTGRTTETIKAIKNVFSKEGISLPDLLQGREKTKIIKERVVQHVKTNAKIFKNFRAWIAGRKFDSLLSKFEKDITEAYKGINKDNIAQFCEDIESSLINEKDSTGKTLLHYAATFGKVDSINKLIGKGADIALQDNEGNTPLHLSFREGGMNISSSLVEKYTATQLRIKNKDGDEPFLFALKRFGLESLPICTSILKKIKTDTPIQMNNTNGDTPWHLLAKEGNGLQGPVLFTWIDLLKDIDQTQNPWCRANSQGETPIDIAARYGTKSVMYNLFDPFTEKLLISNEDASSLQTSIGSPIHKIVEGVLAEKPTEKEAATATAFTIALSHPELFRFQNKEGISGTDLATKIPTESYPELRYILEHPKKIKSRATTVLEETKKKKQVLSSKIDKLEVPITDEVYWDLYDSIISDGAKDPVLDRSKILELLKEIDDKGNNLFHQVAIDPHYMTEKQIPTRLLFELLGMSQSHLKKPNNDKLTPFHLAIQNGNAEFFRVFCGPATRYDTIDWNNHTINGGSILHYTLEQCASKTAHNIQKENIKTIFKYIISVSPDLIYKKNEKGQNCFEYFETIKKDIPSDIASELENIIQEPGKAYVERQINKQANSLILKLQEEFLTKVSKRRQKTPYTLEEGRGITTHT